MTLLILMAQLMTIQRSNAVVIARCDGVPVGQTWRIQVNQTTDSNRWIYFPFQENNSTSVWITVPTKSATNLFFRAKQLR